MTSLRLRNALLAATLAAAGLAPAGRLQAAPPPYIPLHDLRPGMTGYGLSVFAGSRVDTFQVTVVGVQENVRADGDLLIVELAGQDLERSSIAQGMSGSPVYIDGRFAGALAFGWEGALRPLAGVTPAAEMLALPTAPAADGPRRQTGLAPATPLSPTAPAPAELARAVLGDVPPAAAGGAAPLPAGWPTPEDLLTALLPASADGTSGPRWIYRPLGAAAAATDAAAGAGAAALVPGAACAVPLVTGDAALGAIGTVTWVDGARVLMMGHPFMQRGPVDLPLATADILTVFPSRNMSFKMGTIGPVVGRVHHDLRAGLAGSLGPGPELVPVRVAIAAPEGRREYAFGVVDDPQLTPLLAFWSVYNALLAQGDDASQQTVHYVMRSRWDGPAALSTAPLELTGAAAGPAGVARLAGEIMGPLAALMDNEHAPVRLRELSVELSVTRPAVTAAVVGLAGPRRWVAGGAATFEVSLQPRQDGVETLQLPLRLPGQLAPGNYRVVAASAADLFALEGQRAAATLAPTSLSGLLDLVRRPRAADTLVLVLVSPAGGVIVAGQEMPSLPGSVGRLLRTGSLQAEAPLAEYVVREERAVPWVLSGHAVRNLEIVAGTEPVREERRP